MTKMYMNLADDEIAPVGDSPKRVTVQWEADDEQDQAWSVMSIAVSSSGSLGRVDAPRNSTCTCRSDRIRSGSVGLRFPIFDWRVRNYLGSCRVWGRNLGH